MMELAVLFGVACSAGFLALVAFAGLGLFLDGLRAFGAWLDRFMRARS
jgi:hypothetical protein